MCLVHIGARVKGTKNKTGMKEVLMIETQADIITITLCCNVGSIMKAMNIE